MKRLILPAYLLFMLMFGLNSCWDRKGYTERTDTKTRGQGAIVVDENLAPIVAEQVSVFEALHPEADITPVYTGELDAYDLFASDSIRVLVGTRPLNNSEKEKIEATKRKLRVKRMAVDGVALIVNKENTDTLITLDNVRKIMLGEITNWNQLSPDSKLGNIQVVFDRPNSSTARFIADSITHSKDFAPHVSAISQDFLEMDSIVKLPTNKQIIDYVINHKNALGVLGVNWISDPRDTTGLTFDSRIKVMSINNPNVEDGSKYYRPYAAFLGLRYYPLSRDVYVMITDMHNGLPSGFVDFAVGENGQRMVNKSGLYPANVPTRLVKVRPMSEF